MIIKIIIFIVTFIISVKIFYKSTNENKKKFKEYFEKDGTKIYEELI